jgi:hypothetical protein
VLTDYVLGDNQARPWSQHRVQVRTRGLPSRPDDVLALRDAIYNTIQSLTVVFGAVGVTSCERISSLPNGQDDNLRFEYFDNYLFELDLPPTALRPL